MLCRSCYHEIPAGSGFCPRCGVRQSDGAPPGSGAPTSPAPEAAPPGNPWENRAGGGWVSALGETLQESLFRPAEFFRGTAPEGRAGMALAYAVIVGTVSFAIVMLWQHALNERIVWMFGDRLRGFERPFTAWRAIGLTLPIAICLWVVLLTSLFHLSLKIVGAAKTGYGTTLKAVSYSFSALAFFVFPLCGAPVAVVWAAVLQVIGFRELHRISGGRAFLAWALPLFVFWTLAVLAFSLLGIVFMKFWQGFGSGFDV